MANEIETISGHFEEKFSPSPALGKAFDARRAGFFNHRVKWGMIAVQGRPVDTNMCWVGGFVYTKKPWNASWSAHKDLRGSTRNSAAISCAASKITVSGLHFFNVHDGVRMNDAFDWVLQHSWGEYVRDDGVENDHLHSGRVFDCLFDGCYGGISTEPSNSDTSSNGTGNLVELDRVLIRLQPMPYPYKWRTKKGVIDAKGNPYTSPGVPYGHGFFFKLENSNRNPHFSIKNSVFMAAHLVSPAKFDFPEERLIDVCENNTIIWLGPGDFPGRLPTQKFPNGFHVVTGKAGRDLWRTRVTDWHARHPNVGANRKPTSPGSIAFPKKFGLNPALLK